jgi:hypothetical protein
MFVIPTHVGLTHRVVAMLVACALVMWSIGSFSTAQAANLTNISDTLTDSAPSVTSGHLFSFQPDTTVTTGDLINITFPAGFTGVAGSVTGDLTVEVDGSPVVHGSFDSTGQVVQFDNVAATSSQVITVELADTVVTNPAGIQSYEFIISTPSDSGRTRVSIVDTVLVTAEVSTTFDFVVSGLGTTTAINGGSTTGSTTATTIPFGNLTAGTVYTLGQQLQVTTNAKNGFVVTVEQDGNLQSTTGADIDGFIDGAYTDTPAAWQSPTNGILNEYEWGHWGLTTDDLDLSAGNEFNVGAGGDRWVAASTTPREVFYHTGSSDGTEQNVGLVKIGYQVEITPLQEAGDDYQAILTYIATPTF